MGIGGNRMRVPGLARKMWPYKRHKLANLAVVIFRWMVFLPVAYIILYPLLDMLSTSLKTAADVTDPAVVWVPNGIRLDNFKDAMAGLDYWDTLASTLLIYIVSAMVEVFTCAVTAYGFARFKFRFKKIFLGLLMLNIIIPKETIIVSSYMQLKYFDVLGVLRLLEKLFSGNLRFSLLNTPWAFWLPSLFSVGIKAGLFIFIYMQFFKGLPRELEEAAYIDGAGPVRTYLSIIMPSSGVAFLTVSIFSVIWHWNEFYLSSVYMSSQQPLAVKLANLESNLSVLGLNHATSVINGTVMAACLLFILPMLIMFMVLQKNFVQSVDRVGIVG